MAVDYFLKIEGIDGESADDKHKGEIDIHGWTWGAAQDGTMAQGGGGGAGKVSMQDFHFTMDVNKATPKLILACANGQHIKKAVLTCRKAGKDQQEYLVYTFTDVLISSYVTQTSAPPPDTSSSPASIPGRSSVAPRPAGGFPVENITLNYSQMEIEYKEQKADGSLAGPIKAGWNVKANKAA